MKEQDSPIKRALLQAYLKGLPFLDDDQELILVVSELWKIAMTRPEDDDELLSLGIFDCMTELMKKAIDDEPWLLKHQNIYIPYYAAHIVGSYTMSRADHAVRAVESGAVPPLVELLRGRSNTSWVEKRVAIRALGHLASYEETFDAVAAHEEEVVKLAMDLTVSCLEEVYAKFVGVEERGEKLKYQCNLLTRGGGGAEAEDRKAEEWASQLQCWSIHLLNCFAVKERCLHLMCRREFLEKLCEAWGGLANHASPAGIGLIRILCHTKFGRESISRSKHVVENLCHVSRSSDDWQYMAIDCLLLLLDDPASRYEVARLATSYLADLVELRSLGSRRNVGDAIGRAVLVHGPYKNPSKFKNPDVQKPVEEIWKLKVERRRREKLMSREKLQERRVMAKLIKQQGNHSFLVGNVGEAAFRYGEALEICPLRFVNERIMLYCNRANCNLILRDADAAISDSTRALSLSNPPNSHGGSLWIRSQAYDMKGMGKESLMDCVVFINVCIKSGDHLGVKFPYYAVSMVSKQMEATWLFREAQMKAVSNGCHEKKGRKGESDEDLGRIEQVKNKKYGSG